MDEAEFSRRLPPEVDLSRSHHGTGRELFAAFRAMAGSAAEGASVFA